MNKRIAITGGIGSGKSLALSTLKEMGYNTLSSDQIVSDLYKKRKVKKMIREYFPTAITGKLKLTLDRAELAEVAFSTSQNHQLLTLLITPLVMEKIDKLTQNKKGLYFVEVPLLFECEYQTNFDGVWVITRPLKDRIESVKLRSNLSEEQILERIRKQVNYDTLDLSSYTVLQNNGDKENLKKIIAKKLKTI